MLAVMVHVFFTLFGLIAVLCIPGLWIAWNETVFFIVLGSCFTSLGAVIAMSWIFKDELLRPMMTDFPEPMEERPAARPVIVHSMDDDDPKPGPGARG